VFLMKSLAMATMFSAALAFAVPTTMSTLHAQQTATTTADHDADKAKSEADKAGDAAKDAAKKAGSATKHAAKATAKGTKSTAKTVKKDTKNASKAVAHDTKGAVKTSGNDAKNVGAAVKGDVTGNHEKATARCKDGTYWYSTARAGACKDHGGVAGWIPK
jgi:F0F1-type ATP synthase membrane subunit b/b'